MTTIWYADGPDSPRTSPARAAALAGIREPYEVVMGWTVERHPWVDEPSFRATTTMGGYGLAAAINEGRVIAPPLRMSGVANMLRAAPPQVAVVSGIRRGGHLAFGCSVAAGDVLAAVAEKVIVEVDDDGADLGALLIDGNVIATVPRPGANSLPPAVARPADDIDRRIGSLVAQLLPDVPTLQFGPGGIGEGIASAIDRPVRIFSGLVTDAMAGLAERGLVVEPIVATYAWGGEPIRRLAETGMLRLTSITRTHDVSAMSAMPRFVGCNTAVQVGLDGSVNVERVGGRWISGIGGHADYCMAASRSPGGLSIIALRSTTAAGASTIVPRVDVVSTPRSDVGVVVTEHGIADLRGCPDSERAKRLVTVAAPADREWLAAAL